MNNQHVHTPASTRSPSRNSKAASSPAPHTPGVLAVTASMIAKANNSNHPASSYSTPSKGSNRRRQGKSSKLDNTHYDTNNSAYTSADESLVKTEIQAASTFETVPDRSMTPSQATSAKATKTNKKERRSRQQQRTDDLAAAINDEALVSSSEAQPIHPVDAVLADGEIDDNSAPIQQASPSKAARKRRSRPQRQTGASAETGLQQTDTYAPEISPSPTLLSSSAPPTSFLYQQQKKTINNTAQQPVYTQQTGLNQPPVRSSNSADEWDMPIMLAARDSGALTWQQQDLERKSSVSKSNKSSTKKSVTPFVESNKPPKPSGPTALANQAATERPSDKAALTPSKALTWQQELLQRSAPVTPADLFAPLEEGFSGARPAKDSGKPSRSSPSKAKKVKRFDQNGADISEGEGLNKALSALDLQIEQQKQLRSSKKQSGGTGNHSAGRGSHSMELHISPSSPLLPVSSNRNVFQTDKHATGRSARHGFSLDDEGSDDADASTSPAPEDDSPQAQLARLFAKASPNAIPSLNAGNLDTSQLHHSKSMTDALAVSNTTAPLSLSGSPTKGTLYAGPKFHNSPSAAHLPTPKLAAFLNKSRDSTPLAM